MYLQEKWEVDEEDGSGQWSRIRRPWWRVQGSLGRVRRPWWRLRGPRGRFGGPGGRLGVLGEVSEALLAGSDVMVVALGVRGLVVVDLGDQG